MKMFFIRVKRFPLYLNSTQICSDQWLDNWAGQGLNKLGSYQKELDFWLTSPSYVNKDKAKIWNKAAYIKAIITREENYLKKSIIVGPYTYNEYIVIAIEISNQGHTITHRELSVEDFLKEY